MAAQAEMRLGRPVRVMPFDRLSSVNAYDAIYANASLLHVPRDRLPDIITRIWRALKPGGWHFASYKTGKAEGHDAHGRYYNQIDEAMARQIYGAAGAWQSVQIAHDFDDGIFGGPSNWLLITAQK
jgi:hypothetical protein